MLYDLPCPARVPHVFLLLLAILALSLLAIAGWLTPGALLDALAL